jgi:hypothetical protein
MTPFRGSPAVHGNSDVTVTKSSSTGDQAPDYLPADFASRYGLDPLYRDGDGAGETAVIDSVLGHRQRQHLLHRQPGPAVQPGDRPATSRQRLVEVTEAADELGVGAVVNGAGDHRDRVVGQRALEGGQ